MGRFYLGTHRFTPLAATCTEMDWLDIRQARWVEMIRLNNRLVSMNDTRWPSKVWEWDVMTGTDAWFSDVSFILNYAGITPTEGEDMFIDLESLANVSLQKNRNNWRLEASQKTKLETFEQIHDFTSYRTVLKANMDRKHRILVIKLKSGVFPVRLETGRYKG